MHATVYIHPPHTNKNKIIVKFFLMQQPSSGNSVKTTNRRGDICSIPSKAFKKTQRVLLATHMLIYRLQMTGIGYCSKECFINVVMVKPKESRVLAC